MNRFIFFFSQYFFSMNKFPLDQDYYLISSLNKLLEKEPATRFTITNEKNEIETDESLDEKIIHINQKMGGLIFNIYKGEIVEDTHFLEYNYGNYGDWWAEYDQSRNEIKTTLNFTNYKNHIFSIYIPENIPLLRSSTKKGLWRIHPQAYKQQE